MNQTDELFAGSMPAIYDRYLAPLMFDPYADELARRVQALPAADVLETAAGTGMGTRVLARALPHAAIVATDVSRDMMGYAAAGFSAPNVTWQQADMLALPFAAGSFDLVVCQFGVMFVPDKVQAYREARRVLRPGGHFLCAVWGRLEENEITHEVIRAVSALFPDDPPTFQQRVPHGYHDTEQVLGELRAAGFAEVAVESVGRRARTPTPRDPALGFCHGSPLRAEILARDPARLAEAVDAAAAAVAARFGPGAIEAGIRAHLYTAVA